MLALPILVVQAKRLRRAVPQLGAAQGPRSGVTAGAGSPLHLLVLGESTAVGVGVATMDSALPPALASQLAHQIGRPIAWTVSGSPHGLTAKRALKLLPSSGQVDLAVVLLGVNDVFRLTPIARWTAGLAAIAAKLRELGAKSVLFSAVPPVGKFPAIPRPLRTALGLRAQLLDAALQSACEASLTVSYCPVAFGLSAEHVAEDGIHPSRLGYEIWAHQLAQFGASALPQ